MKLHLSLNDLSEEVREKIKEIKKESSFETGKIVSTIYFLKKGNYVCSECEHFYQGFGLIRKGEGIEKETICCMKGMYSLTHNLLYPMRIKECYEWKRGKNMKVDLNTMTEEEIRENIAAIRRERMGTSKRRTGIRKGVKRKSGVKKDIIERVE